MKFGISLTGRILTQRWLPKWGQATRFYATIELRQGVMLRCYGINFQIQARMII